MDMIYQVEVLDPFATTSFMIFLSRQAAEAQAIEELRSGAIRVRLWENERLMMSLDPSQLNQFEKKGD